ncbi:MAG: metallophosphoesterase [Deltaproteobacteria bacterium]|nr:metallophosphoesterase [Deltaproteobacteria bacterium]
MKELSRRDLLKLGGVGLAGIALSGMKVPFFGPKRAYAKMSDGAWKFGVMADSQWRTGTDVVDPASCATTIIDALNEQFIQHGCKFVVQVGDLVDKEEDRDTHERFLPTRADHVQALYDAGIGFFPVRGNHESSATAANEMTELFPQMLGLGANVFEATNFQGPAISGLNGLSYAFDYKNVRCVFIDQFVRADGSCYNAPAEKPTDYNNNAVDQVEWVNSALSSNRINRHAFVFGHKNLIGQNHKDNLFGKQLTDNAEARNSFIKSLYENNVQYYLSGHDHMHHLSTVTTDDGDSSVGQIICSSNSYKFYTPRDGDDGRETPFDQELYTIGYYIITVDGPRVTVDFYSSSSGLDYGDVSLIAPPAGFAFYLRDSFGYSLNGAGFDVAQGESYTKITDSHNGTEAKILSGLNENLETDYLERPLSKHVNTGWSDAERLEGAASSILSLWGMADNLSLYDSQLTGLLPDSDESQECDVYALSMSYDHRKIDRSRMMKGDFVLAARDADDGTWVNAVDLNYDSDNKVFKKGPWRAEYGVGTYGVDPSTSTVWAVINHDGDFIVKHLNDKEKNHPPRRRKIRHCA